MPEPAVGIFNMPAAQYHALDRFSQSGIKRILQSPAHYRAWKETPSAPTANMEFGTIVHAMVLEPHRLPDILRVLPDDAPDKRSTAGRQWHADFGAAAGDRIILSEADHRRAACTAAALLAHPALVLLEECEAEASLLWTAEYGTLCKARADALARDRSFIIDVKTTQDASRAEFERSVWNFRYDIQAAWYLDAVERATGTRPASFIIAAVETAAPFGVMVYRIEDEVIEAARRDVNRALYRHSLCAESGSWPSYETEVVNISLPRWARNREQS